MQREIRAKIVEKLLDDATLYPGLVPGGIYDRRLKQGKGQGATAGAFIIRPGDPAKVPYLQPSIVVFGPNEVQAVDGPQGLGGLVLRTGFLRFHYYVPADAEHKTLLDQIDARIRWNLNGKQIQLSSGYPITFQELEAAEDIDSEEFPGTIMSMRRYVGEYLK